MAPKRAPKAEPKETVEYEPTERETALLETFEERRKAMPKRSNVQFNGDTLESDHKGDHSVGWMILMTNCGTADVEVIRSVTAQLLDATQTDNKEKSEQEMRYAVAHLQSLAPKDELELMLATQMTIVHLAVTKQARKLRLSLDHEATAVYANSVTKLSRTFTAQIETLKKYRSKGEQRVIVEHQHVHIHPGAQAVVGTVNHGGSGEGANEKEGQPHERAEPLRLSERSAVPCDFEANGVPVQGAGQEGLECLPVPRRGRGPALRAVQ